MSAPAHARYVVIGAGIHGLSTAWHLAAELQARGAGSGADIVVLDKTGIGAGASGIACGTIRNNYFQPAMRDLMAHSVDVWESDPQAFAYHPVGYLQISPDAMHDDVAKLGAGRYSHWGKALFISSLDNADPNRSANGFRLVVPDTEE